MACVREIYSKRANGRSVSEKSVHYLKERQSLGIAKNRNQETASSRSSQDSTLSKDINHRKERKGIGRAEG